MPVAVAAPSKKRRRPDVPSYLIYETPNGRPLYYRGYRDVMAGLLTEESIDF